MRTLAIARTDGYLEPCGCGGQQAGGLARRAQLLRDWRAEAADLVALDLGNFGSQPAAVPVVARALGAMGVLACGTAAEDLADYPTFTTACREAGLAHTSLVPPLESGAAPPAAIVVSGPGGPVCGLLSLCFGSLANAALTARAVDELERLHAAQPALPVLLISHRNVATTERLVAAIPGALRPVAVLAASDSNEPAPAWERDGLWWVPVAQRGRALVRLRLVRAAAGWEVRATAVLVADGPRDVAVQAMVDDYHRSTAPPPVASTPAPYPPVTACVPCHSGAVKAWRQQPHAHAVETLEQAGRLQAGCLRCHDERFRRDGQRSPAGDRGIECATCHDALADHLANTQRRPSSGARAACEGCHTAENSPHWDHPTYLTKILAACRAR
ncbi:MAG: hypothetical protein IT204_07540 [Fimbriimonadaceae bacterium]|nr:hypothetical protein [Fimbriimonadaceae bacterium]